MSELFKNHSVNFNSISLGLLSLSALVADGQKIIEVGPARPWLPSRTFQSLGVATQDHRKFIDSDGDGYGDLWSSLMEIQRGPADRNQDTDGDGLSDYEEMLLMRDARFFDTITPKLTAGDRFRAQQAERQRVLSLPVLSKEEHTYFTKILQEFEKRKIAQGNPREKARAEKRSNDLKLLSKGFKAGNSVSPAELQTKFPNLEIPKGMSLGGVSRWGKPELRVFDDADAASSIRVTPLWPGGSSVVPDLTGRRAPTAFPIVGIWDQGGVLTNHDQFKLNVNGQPQPRAFLGGNR